MSWSDVTVGRDLGRRGGRLVLTLLLLLPTACGYQALHGQRGEASTVTDMATVHIDLIADRPGQQLHNFLLDRLNPGGRPSEPKYTLTVEVSETRQDLGIRTDETATRANLLVNARYGLRELESGEVVFEAISASATSFNIVRSDFATLSAENDARRRALREIADEIRNRLAIYFNRLREHGTQT